MSPDEKIKYVKETVDAETAISPSGSIQYHLFSVGHPDNEEWTLLTRSEHRRILYKLEQDGYIKDLSKIGNGDYYALEKVINPNDKKVKVDFTQKGKTSTDYLMEAVEFFKNEYNKIRIKGVTYEYPLGDNLVQSNYDPAPDEINFPFYRRIAIERLQEVGLVTSYEFEERVIDDYGWVFDYAHCKINEDMLTEPQENPQATKENAEQVVETVIRHEHDHKHRFDNSIQEKPVDFQFVTDHTDTHTSKLKVKLSEQSISFDDETAILHVGKVLVRFPSHKKEHYILRHLFECRIDEAIDWELVHETVSGNPQDKIKKEDTVKLKRSIRDGVAAINLRVTETINTDSQLLSMKDNAVIRHF